DQYSLAIVYQELLTGQRPFSGNNVRQLILQHLQAAPNLSSLPPEDRPIIARALAKVPDQRFPNCREMVRLLRQPSGTPSPGLGAPVPTRPSDAVTREAIEENSPATQNIRQAWPPASEAEHPTPSDHNEEILPTPVSPLRYAPAEIKGEGLLFPA